MAARSWVTSICTGIGVAAGAGAAQLGLGYGLGIVAWIPATDDASLSVWYSSLAWVTWLAATSTVLGALFANWLSARESAGQDASIGAKAISVAWRVVIALSAAVGALITVPLVAVPARVARQANNSIPQYAAAGYAIAGVIIGLIMAVVALSGRAIAANVVASVAWLWALAVVAVIGGVRAGRSAGTAELATWHFSDAVWVRNMVNLPGALLMLGVALLIGVLAAWRTGRAGGNRVGVAVSGAAGPVLVAAAYFLTVPGLDDHDTHLSAYVIAPYAVIAGLAGSLLVTAIGPKGAREKARAERAEREAAEAAEWGRTLTAGDSTTETPKAVGADSGSDFFERDLDDDAYAPVRAYGSKGSSRGFGSDAAGSTARASAKSSGKTGSASTTGRGRRAGGKEPLWPAGALSAAESTTPSAATTATASTSDASGKGKNARRRRGTKGGS